MKTQQEVNNWFSEYRISKKDRKRVDGFLMAHDLTIPTSCSGSWAELEDFVSWFNSDTFGSITVELGVEVKECAKCEYKLKEEQYTPKEGEFAYVKTNKGSEYIYCKQGERYITSKLYSLRLDVIQVSDMTECVCFDIYILSHRPATEAEKQQLTKAVEEKYKKTWNGKDWVDVKPEFKRGDFIKSTSDRGSFFIHIFGADRISYGNRIGLSGVCINVHDEDIYTIHSIATPEERELLEDALAEAGKRYNAETLEIEDIWQPKNGEIVALKIRPNTVFAYRKGERLTSFYCGVTSNGSVVIDGKEHSLSMASNEEIIPANEEQKKRFHDALAKEGYKWNAETKQAESLLLLVPDNISIFRCGYILSIGFNDDKQLLWFDKHTGVYSAGSPSAFDKKVRCKLVPCKREDLKAGDVAFVRDGEEIGGRMNDLSFYKLILNNCCYAYIYNCGISVSDARWPHWYKVVPIE